MNEDNLSSYNRRKNDRFKQPIIRNDISTCQAIIRHVGGISNLKKMVENVTGQKVDDS